MSLVDVLRAGPDDMERSYALKSAIMSEISHSPDGVITYGHFVQRNLYGYNSHVPGYYTNPTFSPNQEGLFNPDTIGTMAAYPAFGEAIGEIATRYMRRNMTDSPLHIIEVGGGNGDMMVNMIAGAGRQLSRDGHDAAIRPVMIDRTEQLLERQREKIGRLGSSVVDPVFIGTPLEDVESPIHEAGVVVSNELLDMIPFEVAMKTERSARPGMLFVSTEDGQLDYHFGEAPEELAGYAYDALARNPDMLLHSFQPDLVAAMIKLSGLVDRGAIITMDYGPKVGSDVQIVRNGVPGVPGLELRFPGLFDISVTPDWERVQEWAGTEYDLDDIQFRNLASFLRDSSTCSDLANLIPAGLPPREMPEAWKGRMRQLMSSTLSNYASLFIRKQ